MGGAARPLRILYGAGTAQRAYGTGFVYTGGQISAGLVFEFGHLPVGVVVTIDDVAFNIASAPVSPTTWGGIKSLYR